MDRVDSAMALLCVGTVRVEGGNGRRTVFGGVSYMKV
jgi:hypothetical protein